ncbi:MAG: recombination regulator RecX [Tissierellia bacterium]|nr:recombination regulator RecX [Tissierellia bacterium]
MKITKIEAQKNIERVNIYIDGEFAFGLAKEIQLKYGLSEDMEIDKNFIDEVLLAEERLKAKDKALRFLSYRQRSYKEVLDKLKKEGFSQEIINSTMDFLKNYKLIDDLCFARNFMMDKSNINKYGPVRIKYELYNKGIPENIIDQVLEEYDDEYSVALELAKKKIKSYKNDDKNAIYRKLGGFLQRRGFSYECISKILRELVK